MRTNIRLAKLTPVAVGNIVIRNIYCPGKKRYIIESDFLTAFYGSGSTLNGLGLLTHVFSTSLKDIDIQVHGLNEHTRVVETSQIPLILETIPPADMRAAKTTAQILYSMEDKREACSNHIYCGYCYSNAR